MTIYETVRRVYAYDIDENDFLRFLKKIHLSDSDIQKASSLRELIDDFGCLDEFGGELDLYLFQKDMNEKAEHMTDSSSSYYEDWEDAYRDMEWGVH